MKEDIPGSEFTYSADHIEQRGLSSTGFPCDTKEFTLFDIDTDIIKRNKWDIARVVCLNHILHLDDDVLIFTCHTCQLFLNFKLRCKKINGLGHQTD